MMRSASARARFALIGVLAMIVFPVGGVASGKNARDVDRSSKIKSGADYQESGRGNGRGRHKNGGSDSTVSSTSGSSSSSSAPTTDPPATDPPATDPPTTDPPTTDPPPTTDAPTTQPPSQPTFLWSGGMESGSASDWTRNGGGGIYNSGSYTYGATTERARSGSWSLKATINTSGGTSGVRAFRWAEARAHRAAYYSVWLYIPTNYDLTHDPSSGQFWNVFQFKSRSADGSRNDPVWAFYAQEDGGGLFLNAGWGWGGTPLAGPRAGDNVSGKWYSPRTKVYLPVGRWVHLEAYLNQSKDFDGALKFWQDGTLLFDFSGIRTSFNNCNYNTWCGANEWSANLYSDGLAPNPETAYFDDAAIATSYIY
jgi:hypothetical protein